MGTFTCRSLEHEFSFLSHFGSHHAFPFLVGELVLYGFTSATLRPHPPTIGGAPGIGNRRNTSRDGRVVVKNYVSSSAPRVEFSGIPPVCRRNASSFFTGGPPTRSSREAPHDKVHEAQLQHRPICVILTFHPQKGEFHATNAPETTAALAKFVASHVNCCNRADRAPWRPKATAFSPIFS